MAAVAGNGLDASTVEGAEVQVVDTDPRDQWTRVGFADGADRAAVRRRHGMGDDAATTQVQRAGRIRPTGHGTHRIAFAGGDRVAGTERQQRRRRQRSPGKRNPVRRGAAAAVRNQFGSDVRGKDLNAR